jgi:hypothetical protein
MKKKISKGGPPLRHEEDDFLCPVCLRWIVAASCLPCGHTYCEMCLVQFQLYFEGCLRCGANARCEALAFCKELDNLIDSFLTQDYP